MRRTSSGKWKKIKRVSASGEQYQSAKVTGTVFADYYSVQAYSKTKDGKYIYSGSTRGHCIVNSVAGMIAEGRDTEFAFIQTKVGKNRSADKTIDVNSAAVQALLARYGLAPAVSGSDDPDQPDPGMEQNDANNDAADNDSDGLTVYEDL